MSLSDAATAAKGLSAVISSATDRLKTTDELSYDKGISLLSIKNDLLLSYLHHLTLLAHVKLSGRPLAQHADLVQELVRIRVIFDKIRPLESKLKYQIDKLVRKVQVGAVEDEDVVNDPLAFRPNPAALMARDQASASGSEDEEVPRPSTSGIYKPPRVAPVPYNEPVKGKGKRAEREAVVQPSAILADLAASNTNSHDPYAEPSTGLAAAPSLGRARERELAEMDSYEETNMTRLFQTKRAAKRRREDEARRSGAAPRAGFADLDDFVGALDKNAKRSGGEYETLRSAKRARPEASAGEAGSLKSSGGARSAYKKKGSFTRKLQKASGARGGKR